MKGANPGCLFVFAVFWCGFIAVFDFFTVRRLAWEIAAARFPTAPGVIAKSEVRRIAGSKGRKHSRAEISYRFTVDGQEWTSTDTAGWRMKDSRRNDAALKVARYPVGKAVTVYYDPSAPASSILEPGLQPGHLQIALFLAPFHAIGLLLALPVLRHWFPSRTARPVLEPTDDLRMRVHLPCMPPWQVAVIAFGGAAFLMMFALLLFDPLTMPAAIGGWAVVLAITGYCGLRQGRRLNAGHRDLFIDAESQTVTLPTIAGRREILTVPFSEVGGLLFRKLPTAITYTNKWGMKVTEKNANPRFELALVKTNDLQLPICRTPEEAQLRAIAHALRDTFGWTLRENLAS